MQRRAPHLLSLNSRCGDIRPVFASKTQCMVGIALKKLNCFTSDLADWPTKFRLDDCALEGISVARSGPEGIFRCLSFLSWRSDKFYVGRQQPQGSKAYDGLVCGFEKTVGGIVYRVLGE